MAKLGIVNFMMRSHRKFTNLMVVGLLIGLGGIVWRSTRTPDSKVLVSILPANVSKRIQYDNRRHELITIDSSGNARKQFAKSPIIDINKDGSVSISRHLWGIEHEPYIGLGYGSDIRICLGVDVVYVNRLNLGFGLTSNSKNLRLYTALNYNIWSNTGLMIGIQHDQTI